MNNNKTWADSTLDKIVEILIKTHCPDCMCETDGNWLMGDEPELAILKIIKEELANREKEIKKAIGEPVTLHELGLSYGDYTEVYPKERIDRVINSLK